MKRILFTLFLLASVSLYAQQYVHCTIVCRESDWNARKIKKIEIRFADDSIKVEQEFQNLEQACDYLGAMGYELVTATTSFNNGYNFYRLFFKKEIKKEENSDN